MQQTSPQISVLPSGARIPRSSDNRTEDILHIAQSPAEKRQAKPAELVESEGYDSREAFLEANAHDSVVPGICLTETCDYTTGVEPDQDRGWCECCGDTTVASALVLAGLI